MPTRSIQAFRLPLVLQLMLASKKIDSLQARILDFPLICEHLSKHLITIEQVQTFNFRQMHTLENWLSQKYLKKIATFNLLLENLENPKFVQALCFPSLFEMYDAGGLIDDMLSCLTENHCITLIKKPKLRQIIEDRHPSSAYFFEATAAELKDLQMMDDAQIEKKLFLQAVKGITKDLSIPKEYIESFPDLFNAGIISPDVSLSDLELMVISTWFGYTSTIDFESMIKNLDFFAEYECFRYSFTYLLLFKDKLYAWDEEAMDKFSRIFQTQDTFLYEHWEEKYETLYYPLMNAKVFKFDEYLEFSDNLKLALTELEPNSKLFHEIIQGKRKVMHLLGPKMFTNTNTSNIYNALAIFVYDLLQNHFNSETQACITQLVLNLFQNHRSFKDKDFDTIKNYILKDNFNITSIEQKLAPLFHLTMFNAILENKMTVASHFFSFLEVMILKLEPKEHMLVSLELILIIQNPKIMFTVNQQINDFIKLGRTDFHDLLESMRKYWFSQGGFETLLESMNPPLIDACNITWIHLPILMALLTRKLQFNLQITPMDAHQLSHQHHLAYPSCSILHELSSNQWRYNGFFINTVSSEEMEEEHGYKNDTPSDIA